MKRLTIEERTNYACAAVKILRSLERDNETMRYGEFAKAIGLGEKWEPWHRQQVSEILYAVAAQEKQGGGQNELRYDLLLNERGESGAGLVNAARIVVERP